MSDRRGFIKMAATGLVSLGAGARGLWSQFKPGRIMEGPVGPETLIEGRRYLYFGGTSYYGFQGNPAVTQAACQALQKYGMHPSTSRSGFGNCPLYEELEKKAAVYFGSEKALTVASGYLCNAVGFQSLATLNRFDVVFLDEGSHYSVVDFIGLTGKPVVRFAHADPEDLRRKLKAGLKPKQKPFVVSDGVFPTFGLIAPIDEYAKAVEPYEGLMWLDDNHGVGVLGPNGRGTYEHYGLKSPRYMFGGTMSKAFGSRGGIIPASRELIETALQGHIMNGATGPTAGETAAAITGLDILMKHPEMRTRLMENAKRLKAGLRGLGLKIADTPFPVAAWTLKSGEEMSRVHKGLLDRGVCIQLTHYVGVEAGGALRVVVFATHTPAQIDRLVSELKALI